MVESDYLILVADDEEDIVEMLSYNLTHEGFSVLKAYTGKDAVALALKYHPHLIILDIMLPDIDGIEVCEQIRSHESLKKTIIIFLSARSEDYSQIAGYKAGADDYVTKPFKLKPLIHKVSALLKRHENQIPVKTLNNVEGMSIQTGTIEINKERYSVIVDGKEILLPKKEFNLLHLLASKPGKVFTREVIFSQVWGNGIIVSARTIDVHIRKLREKIGERHIVTLKGVGYKFQD